MRIFIALELPREVINEIKRIQTILKKKNFLIGKFTEAENLHLTLKFLGEIDEEKLEQVKKRLREIRFESFDIGLGRVGKFFSRKRDVIWIKINGEKVHEFQKQIDNVLKDLFEPEQRFMGHITIARPKNIFNKKGFVNYLKSIKVKNLKFKINKFFLKKSELFESGPVYSNLEKYELLNNL